MNAKSCFSSQASSDPAERLLSDLGKMENDHEHAQSTLSDTLEMAEIIRIYQKNELRILSLQQQGLQRPEAAHFNRFIVHITREVSYYKS